MKILEILTEGRDTFKAITLRELYDKRRVLRNELNNALTKGEDDETIQDIDAEIARVEAEIADLERSLNEAKMLTFARAVERYINRTFYVYDDRVSGDNRIRYIIEEAKAKYDIEVVGNVVTVYADLQSGASKDRAREIKALLTAVGQKATSSVTEAKNHMGDREYQTYGGWKAACKKAYPGCTFRGDKDIGAAVLNGKDVGEWDGAVGSVYAKQPVTESIDHKEMLRGLKQALAKATAELTEMEEDLSSMKSAARTDKEHTAVDDFRAKVEKKRALVERLTKRVKLRKAALGGQVTESERGTDFGRSVRKAKRGYNKVLDHIHKASPTVKWSKDKIGNSPKETTPAEYLEKRKLKVSKDVKKAFMETDK